MPEFTIRLFRRDDREQLTALVNAHVAAAVPGLSVSVNTVLGTPSPGRTTTTCPSSPASASAT